MPLHTTERRALRAPPASSARSALQVVLLAFIAVASLYFAQEFVQPIALAALLALILTPGARALEAKGLGRVPAAALTLTFAVAILLAAGLTASHQLVALAADLGDYERALQQKLLAFADGDNPFSRIGALARGAVTAIAGAVSSAPAPLDVTVVSGPVDRLYSSLAPYVAGAGAAAVVTILALFFIIKRDDLSDRVIRLFGQRNIGVTTRALDEAAGRISRYLSVFAAINVVYGIAIGVGLWAIGMPVPVLWGALAALLRFVPYVGAAAGFVGPMLLSIVVFPGWQEPLLVAALFGAVEAVLVAVAEPLIYGKSTGVSPIGLLVFALFWTWLWGPLGLLLATPLTVSLAVAGKYVPSLSALSTVLSEKSALPEHLRIYQRLLAGDAVEAREMFHASVKARASEQVCDSLLLPLLRVCEQDRAADAITAGERSTVLRALDDYLDEMEWTAKVELSTWAPNRSLVGADIVGLANGAPEALVLRMLNLLLAPWGRSIVLAEPGDSAEVLDAELKRAEPRLLLVVDSGPRTAPASGSPRPPNAQLPSARSLPIVWRWDEGGTPDAADAAAPTLSTARGQILERVHSDEHVSQQLAQAIGEGDVRRAEQVFEEVVSRCPLDRVCVRVLAPVLRRLAEDEQAGLIPAGSQARAHDFVRTTLHGSATALRSSAPGAPRAVVACPGERVEDVVLLMVAASLRARGWDVLYLGNTVAATDLARVTESALPQVVLLSARGAAAPGIEALAGEQGPALFVTQAVPGPGTSLAGAANLPPDLDQALHAIESTVAQACAQAPPGGAATAAVAA